LDEVDLDTPLQQKKLYPLFQKAVEKEEKVAEEPKRKKRGRPKKEVIEPLSPEEQEERITRARTKHQLFAEYEKKVDNMKKPDLVAEMKRLKISHSTDANGPKRTKEMNQELKQKYIDDHKLFIR
jgi:hypothetical protein